MFLNNFYRISRNIRKLFVIFECMYSNTLCSKCFVLYFCHRKTFWYNETIKITVKELKTGRKTKNEYKTVVSNIRTYYMRIMAVTRV